ncbi:MAG TPA: pilus assembly protein PilM [Clostridium sp.]|uniref:type IV pilus biogenesis protein PilM n=1 Tax=Clostridium sp. TaxID=1506 RepID=UPI002F93C4CE
MSNLIFNVHENYIEIAQVTKTFNVIKIKKVIDFTSGTDNEDNSIKLKRLLRKNKITSKKVNVILSIDSIVTRQIKVPAMKKKDLENFINNNIGDYFTVNTDDFYFDYEIEEILKEEEKKIFSVLLVAVPKEKLYNIKILLKLSKLIIIAVKIYPKCLINYYKKNKKQSIAVLDVGNDLSSITLTNKGKIFIYSTLLLDMSDTDSCSELTDNLTYFLNFYSTRNFGSKVDKIYVVGEKNEDVELIKTLGENVDIDIIYENNNYVEILGCCIKVKAINNKSIDFNEALNDESEGKEEGQNEGFILVIICMLLIAGIGMGSYYYTEIYLNSKNNLESSNLLSEVNKYSGVEEKLKDLNVEKQDYQKKVDIINKIKNDEFNYVSIIDGIRDGLPQNITVKTLDIQKEKISVTLNIANSTLDVARAVIAINNTKLFKTVDISEVKLDDTVKSISLDLLLKDPS